jgi:hypothetical protein
LIQNGYIQVLQEQERQFIYLQHKKKQYFSKMLFKEKHSLPRSKTNVVERLINDFLSENGIKCKIEPRKGSLIDLSYSINKIDDSNSDQKLFKSIGLIVKNFKNSSLSISISDFDMIKRQLNSEKNEHKDTFENIYIISTSTGELFDLRYLILNKCFLFKAKNVIFPSKLNSTKQELPKHFIDEEIFGFSLEPLKLRISKHSNKISIIHSLSRSYDLHSKNVKSSLYTDGLIGDFLIAEFVLLYHLSKGSFSNTISHYLDLDGSFKDSNAAIEVEFAEFHLKKVEEFAKKEIVKGSHKRKQIFSLLNLILVISKKIFEKGLIIPFGSNSYFKYSNDSKIITQNQLSFDASIKTDNQYNLSISEFDLSGLSVFSKDEILEIISSLTVQISSFDKKVIVEEINRYLFVEPFTQNNSRDMLIGMGSSFNYVYFLKEQNIPVGKIYVYKETFESKIKNNLYGFNDKIIYKSDLASLNKDCFKIFDLSLINLTGSFANDIAKAINLLSTSNLLIKLKNSSYLHTNFFNSDLNIKSNVILVLRKLFEKKLINEVLLYSRSNDVSNDWYPHLSLLIDFSAFKPMPKKLAALLPNKDKKQNKSLIKFIHRPPVSLNISSAIVFDESYDFDNRNEYYKKIDIIERNAIYVNYDSAIINKYGFNSDLYNKNIIEKDFNKRVFINSLIDYDKQFFLIQDFNLLKDSKSLTETEVLQQSSFIDLVHLSLDGLKKINWSTSNSIQRQVITKISDLFSDILDSNRLLTFDELKKLYDELKLFKLFTGVNINDAIIYEKGDYIIIDRYPIQDVPDIVNSYDFSIYSASSSFKISNSAKYICIPLLNNINYQLNDVLNIFRYKCNVDIESLSLQKNYSSSTNKKRSSFSGWNKKDVNEVLYKIGLISFDKKNQTDHLKNFKKCDKGHFYTKDADVCPFCPKGSEEASYSAQVISEQNNNSTKASLSWGSILGSSDSSENDGETNSISRQQKELKKRLESLNIDLDLETNLTLITSDLPTQEKIKTLINFEKIKQQDEFTSGFHDLKQRFRLIYMNYRKILKKVKNNELKNLLISSDHIPPSLPNSHSDIVYGIDVDYDLRESDVLYDIFDNVVEEYLLKFKEKKCINLFVFEEDFKNLILKNRNKYSDINFTIDRFGDEKLVEIDKDKMQNLFYLNCPNRILHNTIGELIFNSFKYAWYDLDNDYNFNDKSRFSDKFSKEIYISFTISLLDKDHPGVKFSRNDFIQEPDAYLEIIYADNGVGFSNIDNMFSMGNRMGMEDTDIKGSGAGMKTMETMVKISGGSIDYIDSHKFSSNHPPGDGMVFCIILPLFTDNKQII